jgi:hypothetical protein
MSSSSSSSSSSKLLLSLSFPNNIHTAFHKDLYRIICAISSDYNIELDELMNHYGRHIRECRFVEKDMLRRKLMKESSESVSESVSESTIDNNSNSSSDGDGDGDGYDDESIGSHVVGSRRL